jgi:sulfide:quinone oxidoreductase
MASVMPKAVSWKKLSVEAFEPDENRILLSSGERLSYDRMVVCPGLTLNWEGVEGLAETLGQNGVTSNYSYKTASYTWELVQSLRSGHAVFTQPPMPIKCAGAPQKAMYLSSNHWLRQGLLKDINVSFFTSTPGLFGVAAYVPALMKYVEKYQAALNFQHTLTKVDGEKQVATFKDEHGNQHEIEFDMLHVCPPQRAPDFIRESALADEAGWVDVDQHTLKTQRFDNIWALGDVMNAPNAKTAAAARAQAPVVAHNLLQHAGKRDGISHYNGYGSCPLTVERGKIVLAEFGYGGSLLPSFPKWLIDGQEPSSLAWLLKANVLPAVYWEAMLKGREWMVRPEPQH